MAEEAEMRCLSEREVRFLCWKVKQGQRLNNRQTFALLNALLHKEARQQKERRATNDNLYASCLGCQERNTLFRSYNQHVKYYMDKAVRLSELAGRKSPGYIEMWKEVLDARIRVNESRREYEQHMAEHGC